MCDAGNEKSHQGMKTIPVDQAVGTVLAHDITEIRRKDFKGPAFRKGHLIREEDICYLRRLGKERLFVLHIGDDELHEDDAALALAEALMGQGVRIQGEPREGKINIVAGRDGLLKIDRDRLMQFNLFGEIMCASLHTNTIVKKDQVVAGTRAIPLVISKAVVEEAVRVARGMRNERPGLTQSLSARGAGSSEDPFLEGNGAEGRGIRGVIEVKELRKPRVGIVITGNEVYQGRIKDSFAPVISRKIEAFQGEIVGVYYAPDDAQFIEDRLRELISAGADLLITTGGMSVDPDDVTRFAIRNAGAQDIAYGSAVLPGAMVLVGYLENAECGDSHPNDFERSAREWGVQGVRNAEWKTSKDHPEPRTSNSTPIPVLGIPACGMYHQTTVFDLILPRILAGEAIGRRELAELGHGGLCMNCPVCKYPVCPFGKD